MVPGQLRAVLVLMIICQFSAHQVGIRDKCKELADSEAPLHATKRRQPRLVLHTAVDANRKAAKRVSFGVAFFGVGRTEQTLQLPELWTQVETSLKV